MIVPACIRREDLTREMVRYLLVYNLITGEFTWRNPLGRVEAGTPAGSIRKDGYVVIKIRGLAYKAHRLAFMYVLGRWPESGDHEDGDPSNNAWINLRFATHGQNCRNRIYRNSTGFQCVGRDRAKFKARVKLNGERVYLGMFDTAEDAYAAVVAAKESLHGAYSSTRRETNG